MTVYQQKGQEIRQSVKSMILSYMNSNIHCAPDGYGMKQAEIFHALGLASNDYQKATRSNQQYWMIALLYELQDEGKIELLYERGPWRLK